MRSLILILFVTKLSFGQNNAVFQKEIPHYQSGKISVYYDAARKNEDLLKLDKLENGFDSLQIRIWYHYPKFRPPKNVFILKKENDEWTSLLYSYDTDTIQPVFPKSSMNKTVKKLLSFDILSLPHMHDIDGLVDNWVDGESYTVEVSSNEYYRLYNYHVPEHFKHKFPEVKKMVKILKLLRKEFNIPLAHWE